MNVAFIPARGGSKGVPGKNIKLINGKPLIAWSILQALQSKLIDRVFVSTDSEEIKNIALEYGAEVPFLRPSSISRDESTTESAVMHFLDWLKESEIDVSSIVLLQATSPIRRLHQIDNAITEYVQQDADSLVSVTKTHHFMWKTTENPCPLYDYKNRPRRQDICDEDQLFYENGSIYISKPYIYEKYRNRLGGKIVMFEMTPEESFEIDDPLDFIIVETIMTQCEL